MRYSRAVLAQRVEPTAILAVVRRLHCRSASTKGESMGKTKKPAKQLKVKIGKTSLPTIPATDLDRVSGGRCCVSPPPTFDC
jgi:hypothetical protein